MGRKRMNDKEKVKIFGPKEYSLHVVGLLLLNAAQIVLTPPAPPPMGARFYRFLGRPAKWTRWLAGAAAIKSG